MASSPNLAAALLLLLTLFSSAAVHGRESHFFSKVAANTIPTTTNTVTVSPDARTPLANTDNNVDPNAVNNRQQNQEQQQQQPSFVQEADNNGYGMYGHNTPEQDQTTSFDQTATTTKLTSSPTDSYLPYNAQTNSDDTFRNQYSNTNNNDEKYYNNDRYYGETGYNGDSTEEFEDEQLPQQQEQERFGGTSLKQQDSDGFQTAAKSNGQFGNGFSGGFENSAATKGYNNYNAAVGSGVQRQGMSDTRYMEGGKYYVEVNNPNQYRQGMMSSSSSSSSSNYNYNDNNNVNQNGYYSNGNNNGDRRDSYEYANNGDQQQAEYYQGNDNYQNQQYVP